MMGYVGDGKCCDAEVKYVVINEGDATYEKFGNLDTNFWEWSIILVGKMIEIHTRPIAYLGEYKVLSTIFLGNPWTLRTKFLMRCCNWIISV